MNTGRIIVAAGAVLAALGLVAPDAGFAADQKAPAKAPLTSGEAREGSPAPDFELPDQAGTVKKLSGFRGKWVLLYFYPKDDTPGCTAEAKGIRDEFPGFEKAGIVPLGVSVDGVESHDRFAKKYQLPFTLLADDAKKVVKLYGVAGSVLPWASRVSFLIDPKGIVAKIYDKVTPAGHAQEVLADVAALAK